MDSLPTRTRGSPGVKTSSPTQIGLRLDLGMGKRPAIAHTKSLARGGGQSWYTLSGSLPAKRTCLYTSCRTSRAHGRPRRRDIAAAELSFTFLGGYRLERFGTGVTGSGGARVSAC